MSRTLPLSLSLTHTHTLDSHFKSHVLLAAANMSNTVGVTSVTEEAWKKGAAADLAIQGVGVTPDWTERFHDAKVKQDR